MVKNRESALLPAQEDGSISSCTATQTWGRNRNLLVAICMRCLFIKFQAATVLHLGWLLGSACSRTALFSICLCSPGAASLPRTPFPRSSPQGTAFLLPKSPDKLFFLVSSSSSPCLLRNGSSAAVKPGAGALSHFSSFPSVCATQGGEKAQILKFSLMGRGMEVPSFAKHRLGNE